MRVPPSRAFAIIATLTTLACSSTQAPVKQTNRQQISRNVTILANATIWTGLTTEPGRNDAVAYADGVVLAVGDTPSLTQRFSGAKLVDLRGCTLLPGVTDAHGHIAGLADYLVVVHLNDAKSAADAARLIADASRNAAPGEWILARGWDQTRWPGSEFPTAAELDAVVRDHPVYARRIDGHAAWVNSAALRAANITASTPDPDGGRILRDASGAPTGVLVDNASDLVSGILPTPSREVRKQRLLRALNVIAANGLTEVHEAALAPELSDQTIDIYKELIDEGRMPIRIYFMLAQDQPTLKTWFTRGPLIGYGGRLTVRAVKVYADGALGSRGAALLQPYSDDPHNSGLTLISEPKLQEISTEARTAGFQVCTHAIGDRGTRMVVDAYEGAGVTKADRFRIEHLQVFSLDDLPRIASHGMIASMQPTHATSDMRWAEQRLGANRIAGAYAWRKVLDAGVPLAFGSDFPIEDVNPFFGIYSAVTRQDHDGMPPGGWRPGEKLTLAEALHGFTSGAAYAAFEEGSRGTIEEGKLADFTVVEGDLFTAPQSELWKSKVRYTIVDGKVVYDSAAAGRQGAAE